MLSLYIPPSRPVSDVLNLLRQELAITDNIKLKTTKTTVQRALTAAIERLSKIPKVPDNGLVLFCGEDMNTGEFICLMLIPPEPVPVYFYRTDKFFHTEFLEEMISETNIIGLVIIERDAATIGLLKGNRLEIVDELEGYVPGKHHRGGQSQRRFDRIIEQMVEEFYKKVGERVNEVFLPLLEQNKLKGILIGGPAYSKYDFVEKDYIDYRLKKIILPKLVDVSYQGFNGLREMIMKAEDVLKEQEYVECVKTIEEFKLHLAKDDGLAIYGEEEVKKALEIGALKTLIISENREDVSNWIDLSKKHGAIPVIVNNELPENEWLIKTFNGIAGILRYRLSY